MKVKGSYTIEAALIVPVVLFCILFILEQAIAFYSETAAIAKQQEMWEKFTPVETFRKIEFTNKILGLESQKHLSVLRETGCQEEHLWR